MFDDSLEHLDIYSLTESSEKKIYQRRQLFEQVLRKCHLKIKKTAETMDDKCIFVIPEYIVGMPLYNSEMCKTFLVNALIAEKFHVIFYHPNILFVSWQSVAKKVNPNALHHYSNIKPIPKLQSITDFSRYPVHEDKTLYLKDETRGTKNVTFSQNLLLPPKNNETHSHMDQKYPKYPKYQKYQPYTQQSPHYDEDYSQRYKSVLASNTSRPRSNKNDGRSQIKYVKTGRLFQ